MYRSKAVKERFSVGVGILGCVSMNCLNDAPRTACIRQLPPPTTLTITLPISIVSVVRYSTTYLIHLFVFPLVYGIFSFIINLS